MIVLPGGQSTAPPVFINGSLSHTKGSLMRHSAFLCAMVAIATCLLSSCFTNGHRASSYSSIIRRDTCDNPPKEIQLYYTGEPVPFEYEQLGYVEAYSGQNSSPQQALDHLKYEAWINCADAIINVKDSWVDRQRNVLFFPSQNEHYTAKSFSGIAVRAKVPLPPKNPGDTWYINRVQSDYKEENFENSMFTIGAIAVIIVAAVWYLTGKIK